MQWDNSEVMLCNPDVVAKVLKEFVAEVDAEALHPPIPKVMYPVVGWSKHKKSNEKAIKVKFGPHGAHARNYTAEQAESLAMVLLDYTHALQDDIKTEQPHD